MTFQELYKHIDRDKLEKCINRELLKTESFLKQSDKEILPTHKRLHECWQFNLNEGIEITILSNQVSPEINRLINVTIQRCFLYQITIEKYGLQEEYNSTIEELIKVNAND